MTNASLLRTLADPASRPDPYSVYAQFARSRSRSRRTGRTS